MKIFLHKNVIAYIFIFCTVISFSNMVSFANVAGLENLKFLNYFIKYQKAVSSIGILIFFLIMSIKKGLQVSKLAIGIILFYLYMHIVAIIHGRPVYNLNVYSCIVLVLGLDMLISANDVHGFRYFVRTGNFLTLLNFVSIVLNKSTYGFYYFDIDKGRYWYRGMYLLGYDNGHIVFLLPFVCINYVLFNKHRKKVNLLFMIIGSLTPFLTFSASSMIAILIFYSLLFVIRFDILKILRNVKFWIAFIVMTYILVFQFSGYKYFSDMLEALFSKTIESARAYMYESAYNYIRESWIFGYGYQYSKNWIAGYPGPHNIIMQLLLYGGIIGVVIFFYLIYIAARKMRRSCLYKESFALLACIIAFLIADLMEGYENYVTFYLFWGICLFMYRSDEWFRLIMGYYQRKAFNGIY